MENEVYSCELRIIVKNLAMKIRLHFFPDPVGDQAFLLIWGGRRDFFVWKNTIKYQVSVDN